MATNVLLTIDTELLWSPDVTRRSWQEALARSFDPAGVGIPYQLAKLAEHRLNAAFFIDPMPALHFGLEPIKHMVSLILDAGQSIELHLHPQWSRLVDGHPTTSFELNGYPEEEQHALIARACELLMAAGAPHPGAFRAGSYAANDGTLRAAAALGFRYDSSHNGSQHPWPSSIGLSADQISPVRHQNIIEVPVTLIRDGGGLRHLQICAVSMHEIRAALRHAAERAHPVVCFVSHSFELATRSGRWVNRTHRQRFDDLCAFLGAHRDEMPTRNFVTLDVGQSERQAEPLPSSALRTIARQAEQLWSNLYEERGA
jgi:hypothetical protein